MKKKVITLTLILLVIAITSLYGMKAISEHKERKRIEKLLDLESEKSFYYFWEQANTDPKSPGYGLIRDRYPSNPHVSSIASVGFGLTAIPIGIENGWITYKEGYDRVLGTLNTFLNNVENINGFYYHFVHLSNGKRIWNSEISIIDTAIFINGALFAGEYFGGEIKEISETLYKRIQWDWFVDKKRNMFYMAYYPEKGFKGHWDFYAEQLMVYILSSGSPTYPVEPRIYYTFKRDEKNYNNGSKFIHSWFGSLFTYQYSHAWIDFRNIEDKNGVNWFNNSVKASKANYQYCKDMTYKYRTLSENSWGITACDGPKGYNGLYGAPPSGFDNKQHLVDGTIPPSGAAGSIVFTPELSINALINYYENHEKLWGKYGFKDAYNLDVEPTWYAKDYIGIDKGITLLMIENYRTEFVWDTFMKNKYIKKGIKNLRFKNEK